MTIGNFVEVLGRVSDFGITGFDSISGADLQIIYGLDGDDNLNSTATLAGEDFPDGKATIILVGGTGRNNYQIRRNSTAIAIENNNNDDNILWTTIGSTGLSLEKETSFVAQIDNRHLYMGDTVTDQYIILIDWQQPANQIETFDLTEGMVSYEDFVSSYQNSSNYRGNFTWNELAATGEIDLYRLGLSPDTIDEDIATIEQRSIELEVESKGGVFLVAEDTGESLEGGINDDYLQGGSGDDGLFGFSGRDTLEGGFGDDLYLKILDPSTENGGEILDTGGELDTFFLITHNTDIEALNDSYHSNDKNIVTDPNIYGDALVELSFPQQGIIGIEKSDNDLIIDLNRDGIAQSADDLTIYNFFNDSGQAGTGKIERINNIIDTQDIIDFVANSAKEQLKNENFGEHTLYRFYDANSGVHFYTSDKNERNYVYDRLNNYTYEGASFTGIDPMEEESFAVHRFYNRDSGTHLYTMDENERDIVLHELVNYNYEGKAFFAYSVQIENSIPIYRFYNSTTGAHFYTPSTTERDVVSEQLSNFESEGIAYYALSIDSEAV